MAMPKRMAAGRGGRQQDESRRWRRSARNRSRREASASACAVDSQPDPREPTALARPITASVQPPTDSGQAGVLQVGRQMHGDEGELEAAGEEAEHEQHVAAVPEGLRQRLRDRLARQARAGPAASASPARRRRRATSGSIRSTARGEDDERLLPAERLDENVADRREQELAEGAGRGAGAEGERTPASGRSLPKAPRTRLNEQPDEAEADQHAGAEMQHARRRA